MKRCLSLIIVCLFFAVAICAQKVSVKAINQPAAVVFRSLVEQTGKNFVYSSDLLKDVRVTVSADRKPLKAVLNEMFHDSDIEFKIKGNNIVLKRRKKQAKKKAKKTAPPSQAAGVIAKVPETRMLDELLVVSRLESPAVETAEIGAKKVTANEIRNTPALFGEADVIKSLHTQPGVVEGAEGMAGMYVHGGNSDENLYMLDNVPMYQVNHFAGLFSAFNPDIIRYIDFYKSSIPAKYDGRLSSYLDVRLKNGSGSGHHGTAKFGLTSGAFNIAGPISKNTTYMFGLRRSWFDLLTIPFMAFINKHQDEETKFHYYFMDINAKVSHRFSDKASGFVSVYFGDDRLKLGEESTEELYDFYSYMNDFDYVFHWGNLVAQTGLNYRINQALTAEFTAAYTRFFSDLRYCYLHKSKASTIKEFENRSNSENNINDWIFRGDFDWQPDDNNKVRFGANYVRHSFLPARFERITIEENAKRVWRDSIFAYHANEVNAYIEDDWRISNKWRVNAGFHVSLFNIDHKVKYGLSPRLSASYRPIDNVAVKAAFSRTTQYVHQLTESYISLPTDQWVPVTGDIKPQTAEKIAVGGYWQSPDNSYAVSVEGYYKWMHNIVDYDDEYYLKPPSEIWNARLTQGRGSAKGIDFKIEKLSGKFTGHIAYSLAWADRTFPDKNRGLTFPARFDQRHSINVLVNWNISRKVSLNASWTGHSGNRYTFSTQMWYLPDFGKFEAYGNVSAPLSSPINNYQLPFYHRLDLSCTVRNRRGYWTFGLYNAYNHVNVIAIRRGDKEVPEKEEGGYMIKHVPSFQKVKFLPIIPSISYTWEF